MSTLYEITGEMLLLMQMAEESDDVEEIMGVLKDTFDAVSGEHDVKIENCAKVIRSLEAKAKAVKAEEAYLAGKRKTIEANVDRIKTAMMESMRAVGKTKAGGDIFTVSIQKNGGKAPLIIRDGVNADLLPDAFKRVTVDFNKDAIREALENGEDIDFAVLGERGESLRIR